MPRPETIGTIYRRSPVEALNELFSRERKRLPYTYKFDDGAFMFVSTLGIDGRTRYGSYKTVTRKMLEGRAYDITFYDYAIGIFFTDVLFDPKTNTRIPKPRIET